MAANSAQARAIYDAACALDHPTADQVFRAVREAHPKVSLATVYRNLDRMVADGELSRRTVGSEKRYDHNTEPHLHLHDAATDRLVDLPLTPALETELRRICDDHFDGRADCLLELRGTLKETP